jgi:uncharacterized protein (TIGR02246 family)
MEAWNQGSGAASASVFTEDGDLVEFDGTHLRGRDEIAPFHQQLFGEWLKGESPRRRSKTCASSRPMSPSCTRSAGR